MDRFRYVSVAVLSAIMVVLAIQNLNDVEVHFLAWDFQVSVSLLVLVTFLAGLLVGSIGALLGRRPSQKEKPTEPEVIGEIEPGVAVVSDEVAEDVTEEIKE